MLEKSKKIEVREKIRNYLRGFENILFAYIFGSFIDEDLDYFRDIDIAIYLREPIQDNHLNIEITLTAKVAELIGYEYEIDLVLMNNKDISLLANIIEGEVLFIKDEDLWSDYVTYIAMSYNDMAYYRDLYLREAYLEHQ